MTDFRTKAHVVSIDRGGAIGTVVTRSEIAEAAASAEFPAMFILDLNRAEAADSGEVTAHARVAVEWEKATLEQLLATTDCEEIGLWFDEAELAQAFAERDVEGHGLRQRAAVIAVAVAAVGAGAAPSLATVNPGAGGGGGGGGVARTVGFSVDPQNHDQRPVVQPAGAERALLQDERIFSRQTQSTTRVAATSNRSDSTPSPGELAAAAAAGALLITAAGFGVARKRTPPVLPA